MNIRFSYFIIVPLLVIFFACIGTALAQSTSADAELAGGFVSGGGLSSSGIATVAGAVAGSSAGQSQSASASLIGGPGGSLSFAPMATFAGQAIDTMAIGPQVLRVHVPGLDASTEGTLHYRLGGRSTYSQATMTAGSADTLVYTLNESLLTSRGLDYYFLVRHAGLPALAGSESSPFRCVVSMTNAQGQNPSSTPAESYRIVSVPIDITDDNSAGSVFADDLGNYDKSVWRLGRYSAAYDSVSEYPSVESVVPGNGYWLIAAAARSFGSAGLSIRPNRTHAGAEYYEVPLDAGWNQLANPFPFDISWDEVMFDDNGAVVGHIPDVVQDSVYSYNGSAYVTVSSIPAWSGFFVYIEKSGVKALFRYREAGAAAARKETVPLMATSATPHWQMQFSLTSKGLRDDGNFIGVCAGSEDTRDVNDFCEPPRAPKAPMLAFEMSDSPLLYRCDYRREFHEGTTWTMQLSSGPARELEISGVESIPIDMSAWLITDAGSTHDLTEGLRLTLPNDVMAATVVIGRESFIEQQLNSALPKEYALAQNFPNPFNPITTIRYALPRAASVRLAVYNILGRQVRILVDERMEAGHHYVDWNGTDDRNRTVSSGVYFYRIQTSDYSESRKMILLK